MHQNYDMFGQSNQHIRNLIDSYGFKHWQVAYELGINENTLSRWFRVPLSKNHKKAIIKALNNLSEKRKNYAKKQNK